MYGQTEATARIAYVPPERLPDKLESIGLPIPGGSITLMEADREITEPRVTGEIVYRGPNVMLGYATDRACLAKGDELNGVLRTGDLAFRDDEGYFQIVGRLSRFIKLFGHRMNLDEVEQIVERHLDRRTACLGRDDLLLVACEAACDDGLRQKVTDLVTSMLGVHPSALEVRVLPRIPITSTSREGLRAGFRPCGSPWEKSAHMNLPVADTLERLFAVSPYGLDRAAKMALIEPELGALGAMALGALRRVLRRLVRGMGWDAKAANLANLPFVPVRLFKEMKLQSVADADVFKVLTSSGTSGQIPSRIVLDTATAQLQTRALLAIMTSFTGKQRLPMVICDSQSVLRDRNWHSARAAGILGMSSLGRQHFYALDSEMRLDLDALAAYLTARPGEPILFFGFTFMVWQHVVEVLRDAGRTLPANDGILIHGGGWKKLADKAVDNAPVQGRLRARRSA